MISSCCDLCTDVEELDMHVLRDCPESLRVWRCIVSIGWWFLFYRPVHFVQWFQVNLGLGRRDEPDSLNWFYVFRQIVHELWYNHTRRRYGDSALKDGQALAERSLQSTVELLLVWG